MKNFGMDCGCHGCLFALDKSGQRTNNGCTCCSPSNIKTLGKQSNKFRLAVTQLRFAFDEMKKALEFYADEKNWKGLAMGHEWIGSGNVELDKGKIAREALVKFKEDKK